MTKKASIVRYTTRTQVQRYTTNCKTIEESGHTSVSLRDAPLNVLEDSIVILSIKFSQAARAFFQPNHLFIVIIYTCGFSVLPN